MDLKEIQNLIKFVAKSGASEVKLETGDVKITIKTGSDEKETTSTTGSAAQCLSKCLRSNHNSNRLLHRRKVLLHN